MLGDAGHYTLRKDSSISWLYVEAVCWFSKAKSNILDHNGEKKNKNHLIEKNSSTSPIEKTVCIKFLPYLISKVEEPFWLCHLNNQIRIGEKKTYIS